MTEHKGRSKFQPGDRLRALNAKLVEALQDVAEQLEFANLKMGAHGEGDGADHRADAVPIPGCAGSLAEARAPLAEAQEVDRG